jgi:peroxiredoxin
MIRTLISLIVLYISVNVNSQTTLPSIILKSADGDEIRLSDFTALKKPLIISFWATYCNPCLQEFEAISDLYKEWKKEIDFEFIAVSIDDSRSAAKVKSLASGRNWPFVVLVDENQNVKRAMNVNDIPFCFLFDKNGKYVYRHSGYLPGDEYILLKELRKISNE